MEKRVKQRFLILGVTAVVMLSMISAAAFTTPSAPAYVLRTHGDLTGVFVPGSLEPKMVVEIYPSLLRAADREALDRGIEAGSWEELLLLMEDLGS